ncbi:MAG: lysozyme inhibitor LprI family protein, partial [Solirubrobacteraceae bacterium]
APVVIHETFTPLPCLGAPAHRTTLQMEGCAERQILRTDSQINLLAAQIFPILPSDRARRDFNAAQRAWLSYRKADCFSMSDVFEGGTEAGVIDAQCVANRNGQRIKDLRAFHRDLTPSG